jgi:replicative DNA helicase
MTTTTTQPDHALDAEAAVLGTVLSFPERLPEVAFLTPDDFFQRGHGRVWEAILEMAAAGEPIDVVTLCAFLRDRGRLAGVGGTRWIAGLFDGLPVVDHIAAYAKIIRDAARVRRLERAATEIAAKCRTAIPDRTAFLAEARQRIEEVTLSQSSGTHGVLLGEAVADVLEAARLPPEDGAAVPTGFETLDRMTSGLAPGDLWILAARPGMGKTSLAICMALNAAFRGRGVVFFSMEMGRDQIAQRAVCSESRVDLSRLRSGALSAAEWQHLDGAFQHLAHLPLWIDDFRGLRVDDLLARATERQKAWEKEGIPLSLVVVDYLHLLRTSGTARGQTREQEVAEISRALKALAGTLRCPVLALAQLSRDSEKQQRRPRPSDIRDSGQVEQDADVILFLHRDRETPRGCLDLIIAKQRQGQVGKTALAWWPRFLRFEGHLSVEDAGDSSDRSA